MSQRHEDIEFELSQLLDGELSAERARELRQRMAGDPALAEQFRLYQSLQAGIEAQADDLPAVDWNVQRESIRAALERDALLEMPVRIWPGRLMRWAAAGAAAAAMIVAAAMLWSLFQAPPAGPQLDVVVAPPTAPPAGEAVVVAQVLGPPARTGRATLEVAVREPTARDLGQVPVRPWNHQNGLTGTVVVSTGRSAAPTSAAAWLFADIQ